MVIYLSYIKIFCWPTLDFLKKKHVEIHSRENTFVETNTEANTALIEEKSSAPVEGKTIEVFDFIKNTKGKE